MRSTISSLSGLKLADKSTKLHHTRRKNEILRKTGENLLKLFMDIENKVTLWSTSRNLVGLTGPPNLEIKTD